MHDLPDTACQQSPLLTDAELDAPPPAGDRSEVDRCAEWLRRIPSKIPADSAMLQRVAELLIQTADERIDALTALAALRAERDAMAATLAAWQSSQTYRYIGRDGKPVLARDLEDRAEAAEARALAVAAAALERAAGEAEDQERACAEWFTQTGKHANVYEQFPIVAGRIRALITHAARTALDAALADARKTGKMEGLREATEACNNQRTARVSGARQTDFERGYDSAVVNCTEALGVLAARVEGGDA